VPTLLDISQLSIDDLLQLALVLRECENDGSCMEEVAQSMVRRLFECLTSGDGIPACALVRLYVTQRFGDLDAGLQRLALETAPDDLRQDVTDSTRCFTLLASAGTEPTWNDRTLSVGHQAIPLVSEELIERLPMVARLLRDLGIEAASVVSPEPGSHIQRHHRRYDVFHVEDATTSPAVPAKEFVREHGIKSAVGLGGVLPSGELYCVLLFSKVTLQDRVVELLGPLAVTMKAGIVPHTFNVYAP